MDANLAFIKLYLSKLLMFNAIFNVVPISEVFVSYSSRTYLYGSLTIVSLPAAIPEADLPAREIYLDNRLDSFRVD